jgi:hypothetical protein
MFCPLSRMHALMPSLMIHVYKQRLAILLASLANLRDFTNRENSRPVLMRFHETHDLNALNREVCRRPFVLSRGDRIGGMATASAVWNARDVWAQGDQRWHMNNCRRSSFSLSALTPVLSRREALKLRVRLCARASHRPLHHRLSSRRYRLRLAHGHPSMPLYYH